jgi:type II secretory pathway pseudopilin PulG
MGLSVKKQPKGMTLIEAVVASAIAAVIGTIMLTVISLNSQQVKRSTSTMKLCMGYDIAVAQIAMLTRSAKYATVTGDAWPPNAAAACTVSTSSSDSIKMRDNNGSIIGGFKFNGNNLQEYDIGTGQFKDFKINPADTGILVTASPASRIIISASRKAVTLELNVFNNFGGISDTFRSGRETFLCRN